jgi:hypothetical protein
MRAVTLSLLGFLVLSSVALWAGDATPAVDRHDAAAVAHAYVSALKANDFDGAKALMTKDPKLQVIFDLMDSPTVKQLRGGQSVADSMTENAVMPMGLAPDAVVGAGAPGEKGAMVFELRRTVDLHPRLVLAPQPDGTWLVDVRASLAASAGAHGSSTLKMLDQLGDMGPGAFEAGAQMMQRPLRCLQKMGKLAAAVRAYAEEHDNRFPLAAVWQDAVTPYMDGEKPFVCPDHATEDVSYAFNAALSEKPLPKDRQQRQALVVLACTGADTPNAVFTVDALKKLKGRHDKYSVIGLADGEAEAVPVGQTWEDVLAAREADGKATTACQDRLRALVAAAKDYAKAHDGRLPAAATWCDDLEALVKRPAAGANPFTCPASPDAACCYAINRALAGRALKDLVYWRKLVLFVEVGPTTRNAAVDVLDGYPGRHGDSIGFGLLEWHKATLDGRVEGVPGKKP